MSELVRWKSKFLTLRKRDIVTRSVKAAMDKINGWYNEMLFLGVSFPTGKMDNKIEYSQSTAN